VLRLVVLLLVASVAWILYFSGRRLRALIAAYRELARSAQENALAYRESERRYRKIIESAEEGIWIIDADERTTLVNAKLAQSLGYSVEEMKGSSFFDFIDTSMVREGKEQLARRRTGVSEQHDFRFRRRDGSYLWAIVAAHPIYHERTGAYSGMVALITDITDRKREETDRAFLADASAILATSLNYQETLRKIVRLAVQRFGGWCSIHTNGEDDDLQLVAVAHADPIKEALGEAIGRGFPLSASSSVGPSKAIRTNRAELVPENTDEMLQAAAPQPDHLNAVRAEHPRSLLCVPLSARNQTFGAISFISADRSYEMADLRLAEELARRFALAVDNALLFESEQRSRSKAEEALALLDTVLNSSPVGLAFLDRDLNFLRVNRSFVSLCRADETQARIGANAEAALSNLPARALHAFRDTIQGGAPVLDREISVESRWTPEVRHLLMSCYPVNAQGGQILGVGVVIFDITQRKSAEETLQGALRSRDEFLSVASHELKTPLTALYLKLQLLGRAREHQADLTDAQVNSMIRDCEVQSRRLAKLIDQLLDLTRIRSRRLELKSEEVNLTALAKEITGSFETELAQAGSSLSFRGDAPVVGSWDRTRIEQVLTNLLSNAIKYGRGKPIEVSVEGRDGVARLSVKDHGAGIDPSEQPKIFDKFERASPSKQIGGLGLGLYIVRQIVVAHGGSVAVHSTLGDGSTFIVELPKQPSSSRPGLTQSAEGAVKSPGFESRLPH
jgi:PAS domain S-box-containing protein